MPVGARPDNQTGSRERYERGREGMEELPERDCATCGQSFTPTTTRNIYCQRYECAGASGRKRALAAAEDRTLEQGRELVLGLVAVEIRSTTEPPPERIETRLRALLEAEAHSDTDWLQGALIQVAADAVQWALAIEMATERGEPRRAAA